MAASICCYLSFLYLFYEGNKCKLKTQRTLWKLKTEL